MVGANGVIYCADPYNNLVANTAATGHSIWTLNLPGGIETAPIVVNGCVWVATTQSARDQLLSYC
jgi:outer membrane protein assembly factor BamB